jgi:hypothetical protein
LAAPPKDSPFPELRLRNGSSLHGRSSARGGTYLRRKGAHGVILTEADVIPETVYTAVIRAMVLDTRGQLELESTPNGPDNYVTRLFQLGQDPDQQRYRSQHNTVYDNPRLDRAEIDAIRLELPEHVWKVEHLAEVLDDELLVFPWAVLEPVFDDYPPQPFDPTHRYAVGCDLGQQHDWTVIVVVDLSASPHRLAHWERFRGRLYTADDGAVAGCTELRTTYGFAPVFVDATSEHAVAELIPGAAPFVFTEASRKALYDGLQLQVQRRLVELPASWTVLRDGLRALRTVRRGLRLRVDHPGRGRRLRRYVHRAGARAVAGARRGPQRRGPSDPAGPGFLSAGPGLTSSLGVGSFRHMRRGPAAMLGLFVVDCSVR